MAAVNAGGGLRVSWPLWASDWALEQKDALTDSGGPWTGVSASQYQTNEGTISFTVPTSGASTFYRLRYR
jgi:hypothetical protein